MDPSIFELTLEQELQIAQIRFAVEKASREQLGEMLLQLATQLAVKDNIIKDFLRKV
ncbi:MAG: NblA/ycf18 family protein [Microcoleus sp.]